jgi:hypothetical protein
MLIKRLKGDLGSITKAANHNKRTHGAASADPMLSHLNISLRGPITAKEVTALAKQLLQGANVRLPLRRDAVVAIEVVCSLPVASGIEIRPYFEDCVAWVARHFGGEQNILSADVHLDEPGADCPHCHVLVLPLVRGKMNGSDLFGSDARRKALAAHFHDEVGSKYGLQRSRAKLVGPAKSAAAQQVLDRLHEDSDPVLVSAIWAAASDAIARDPEPFMEILGITPKPVRKPLRTFEAIALSTGKGPKTEAGQAIRDRKMLARTAGIASPMGFDVPAIDRTPSCVGFAASSPSQDPSYEPSAAGTLMAADPPPRVSWQSRERLTPSLGPRPASEARTTSVFSRERDSERAASSWNPERGEFLDEPPQPVRRQRAAAEAWVEAMLVRNAA